MLSAYLRYLKYQEKLTIYIGKLSNEELEEYLKATEQIEEKIQEQIEKIMRPTKTLIKIP